MKIIKKIYLSIIALVAFIGTVMIVHAASMSLSETLSTTSTVVGNTVTVTVRISSTAPLGYVNYSMSYDSSKLTLTSGTQNNALYSFTGSEKQTTITFKFRAKASGSAYVSFKVNEALDFDGNNLSGTKNVSRTITIRTQAEIEASYSKNNNLSKLSISSGTLSPAFNKNTLTYNAEVPNEVTQITVSGSKEDSRSYVDGFKSYNLEEGINKINVKVTAQNGSSKTYTINVTRKELAPIVVKVNNKEYNVVRKKALIESPNTNYEETTIKIDEEEDIPAFFNKTTNTTLVGLKDSEGNVELYEYKDDNYTLYKEYSFDSIIITAASKKNIPEGYVESTIKIGEDDVVAYKSETNDDFYLINAINIATGEENLYQYDKKENTIQIFNTDLLNQLDSLESKNSKYTYVIIGLGALLIITYIALLISSIKKPKKKKITNEVEVKEEKKKEKKEEELPKPSIEDALLEDDEIVEDKTAKIENLKEVEVKEKKKRQAKKKKNETFDEEIEKFPQKDGKIKEDISSNTKKKKK